MIASIFNIAVLATAVSAIACPKVERPSKSISSSVAIAASASAVAQIASSRAMAVSAAASAVANSPIAKAAAASASPASVPTVSRSQTSRYPFNNLVAFGDELSDNGNGSYAHGITGDPATVYGYGTWTNGPVAVSYLNDLLGLGSSGMQDYAFGGCCGGGSFGATLDNDYTKSDGGADSLVQQIHNYTTTGNKDIKTSLQFIWIGENDVSKHTNAFWLDWAGNKQFATDYSTKVAASVQTLLDAGAPYVFVANIYPKHIAPVTAKYLCGAPDNDCVKTWGQVIQNANTALKSSLGQFGDKVIYYDSFSYITGLTQNAVANGFTRPLTAICDGAGDAAWNDCITQGNYPKYFWLNFIQPTTRVHQLIAVDMKNTIDKHFGL